MHLRLGSGPGKICLHLASGVGGGWEGTFKIIALRRICDPDENKRLRRRFPELISNVSQRFCNIVNHFIGIIWIFHHAWDYSEMHLKNVKEFSAILDSYLCAKFQTFKQMLKISFLRWRETFEGVYLIRPLHLFHFHEQRVPLHFFCFKVQPFKDK